MTDFEAYVRSMLTNAEKGMLDKYLTGAEFREGMIASLIARTLRDMDKTGLLEVFANLEGAKTNG